MLTDGKQERDQIATTACTEVKADRESTMAPAKGHDFLVWEAPDGLALRLEGFKSV